MPDKFSLKQYLLDNKWLLVAFLFFVFWKFFLIHTLWEERNIPPVPDDSYIYILHIDSSLNCENLISCHGKMFSLDTYAGLDHLTYRVFLGVLGKLLRIDALDTYHLGFYIGTILLAIVLIFFLRSFDRNNKPLIAFLLFVLALYNGAGSYHGFYWVVPSFFALMFFFLILGILLRESYPHWKSSLSIIIPLMLYTHSLGLYLLLILPIFLLFYSIGTRKFHPLIFRKIFFTGCIALVAYIPMALYFSHVSYGNPYGPEVIVRKMITKNTQTYISPTALSTSPTKDSMLYKEHLSDFFPIFQKLEENYFAWIAPNFVGYIVYIVCIGILFYRKKHTILSLYFAGLTFSLLSTIDTNGERSLLFLWPMTFLLYGQASWETFQIITEKILSPPYRVACQILTGIIFCSAVLLSASYSYFWNKYLNHMRNLEIPDTLEEYLTRHTHFGETITYSSDMIFLDHKLLLDMKERKPERVSMKHLDSAKFYITTADTTKELDANFCEPPFDIFLRFLGKTCAPHGRVFGSTDNEETLHIDTGVQRKRQVFGAIELYTKQDP